MKNKLKTFDKFFDCFIKMFDYLDYKFFEENKSQNAETQEKDLVEKLNNFDENIWQIYSLKQKFEEKELDNIFNSLQEYILNEFNEAEKAIINTGESISIFDNYAKLEEVLNSKVNRIFWFYHISKSRTVSLKKNQKLIYEEYQKTVEIFQNKIEKFKKIAFNKSSMTYENLFKKFVDSKPKNINEKDLKYDVLVDNIKKHIPIVPLGISYSFDEKFFLWAIKNDLAEYLK